MVVTLIQRFCIVGCLKGLDPQLFSILINDLSFILRCATNPLYANDMTIFVSDYDSTRLNTLLNNEVND